VDRVGPHLCEWSEREESARKRAAGSLSLRPPDSTRSSKRVLSIQGAGCSILHSRGASNSRVFVGGESTKEINLIALDYLRINLHALLMLYLHR